MAWVLIDEDPWKSNNLWPNHSFLFLNSRNWLHRIYVNVSVLWVSSEPFVLCVRFRFGNPENLSQLLLKASKQCAAKIDIYIIIFIFKLLLLGLYKWNILSQYHQYHDDDDDKEPLLARCCNYPICANCTATDLNVATENLLREPWTGPESNFQIESWGVFSISSRLETRV